MLAWSLCIFCLIQGFLTFMPGPGAWGGARSETRTLERLIALLQRIQETIEAGLVPEREDWERLAQVPRPWGLLAHSALLELRDAGGSVLPTVRRLRALAEHQRERVGEAKAKTAQAMAQAWICIALVPLFGTALYELLPGVPDHLGSWVMLNAIAMSIAAGGAAWLVSMSEKARWGGLAPESRGWVLSIQCMGEQLLALVRAGTPADIGWSRSCQLLDDRLLAIWGASPWTSPGEGARKSASSALDLLLQSGDALRKAIQVSLMEGRSCTERIEAVLQSLRADLRAQTEWEISLLGTRALKPLFLLVAPALLLVLGYGLFLAWDATWTAGF